MFKNIKNNAKLRTMLNEIYDYKSNYNSNPYAKNSKTGKPEISINVFLSINDLAQFFPVVSLNDRKKIIEREER